MKRSAQEGPVRGQQLREDMREPLRGHLEQRMRRGPPPPPPNPWWTRMAELRAEGRMEEVYWEMTKWKYENFGTWDEDKHDDDDDKDEDKDKVNNVFKEAQIPAFFLE